jgi:hypothetical protein
MKSLKFKKCSDGHYIILGYRGIALGVIKLRGSMFKRSMVSSEFERDTEMTAKCHRQLADFMDSLKSKESRPTGRQKLAAQYAKVETRHIHQQAKAENCDMWNPGSQCDYDPGAGTCGAIPCCGDTCYMI